MVTSFQEITSETEKRYISWMSTRNFREFNRNLTIFLVFFFFSKLISWNLSFSTGEYTCTALNPYGEAICTVYISPEATKQVKKSKSGAKLNKSGSNKVRISNLRDWTYDFEVEWKYKMNFFKQLQQLFHQNNNLKQFLNCKLLPLSKIGPIT